MDARTHTMWVAAAAVLTTLAGAHAAPNGVATPTRVAIIDTERRLDVGQINLRVRNDGLIGYDPGPPAVAGLEYPKGSGHFAMFAGGLWLTAKVGVELRGALAQFESEYGPGAILGGTWADPLHPDFRVYKVARWSGNPQDTAHVMRDPSADPNIDPLLHHGWSEYVAGAVPYGAPVRTYRLPVTATPDPADSMDVQGPDVAGDQMLWCVYNDADPLRHTCSCGETAPLGIEVQETVYALDNARTVSVRYRLINKGVNVLDSLLIGLWSDADLGWGGDDRIGSDSALALVYTYNGDYEDGAYGMSPPALGFTLPRGPAGVPSAYALTAPLKPHDPTTIVAARNQMMGLENSGLPKLDPEGIPSLYWYSGDAVHGTGWLDPTIADRRMMLTVGPVTMAPGDTQTVEFVIAISQGADNLSSVAKLLCETDRMMDPYLPNPPDVVCLDEVAQSCPRSVDSWLQQCAGGGLPPDELTRLAKCVDESAVTFGFSEGQELQLFCDILNTANDDRSRALREYLVFLANVCAAKLGFGGGGVSSTFLGPGIEMWSRLVGARWVSEMAAPSTSSPCFCADSLLVAQTLLPTGDPTANAAYRALTGELVALNNGFGLGPTCEVGQSAPVLIDVTTSQSLVSVRWDAGAAAGILVAVYRQQGSNWQKLWQGFPTSGIVSLADPSVNPGQTYRYRLGINPDGREEFFAEAVAEVPTVPQLSPTSLGVKVLDNPGESVRIVFNVPASGAATVELFDLRGRLIERRRYSSLTPGQTVADIGGPVLDAGIYLVQVRQGGLSTSAKAVIVR